MLAHTSDADGITDIFMADHSCSIFFFLNENILQVNYDSFVYCLFIFLIIFCFFYKNVQKF